MKKPALFLILITASLSVLLEGQVKGRGYESISPNDLRAHLNFLASDELEGRETTYRGQKIAALYIASVFQRLGLKPAGHDGSFFQDFPLTVVKPSEQTTITLRAKTSSNTLLFGRDFLTIATVETTLTAPALFIGFMDTPVTPELAEAIRGKVVVAFAGQKDAGGNDQQGRRRRPLGRVFPGSAATIAILDETADGSLDDLRVRLANQIVKGEMNLPDRPRERGLGRFLLFTVNPAVGSELLAPLNRPLPELRRDIVAAEQFRPLPLENLTLSFDVRVDTESTASENVAGILEGSDPVLRNEYVILTAHYDHVGIDAGTGEIYNGADDNASGTATILELAEAFALDGKKPKRSLVFMAFSGEEKGLLGSRYYSENPLLPLEQTTANINMDMIGRTDHKYRTKNDSRYIYVIGSDKISTQLDSLLRAANNNSVRFTLDYQYNDDQDPNQFYRRSDQYHFVRKGIPAVFFFSGLHEDYHRPTDTADKIEFDKLAGVARLIYATAREVADFGRALKRDVAPAVSTRE